MYKLNCLTYVAFILAVGFGSGCASTQGRSDAPAPQHSHETAEASETPEAVSDPSDAQPQASADRQASTISNWSLDERCGLFELLARQYLHMMGWTRLQRYIHDDAVRMFVLLDSQTLLIGPNESCSLDTFDVLVFPAGTNRNIEVHVSGPPIKRPKPYLSLELQPSTDQSAASSQLVFSWRLNRVYHDYPVDDPVEQPPSGGIRIKTGPVTMGAPAPTAEIVVDRHADGKGFSVRRAVLSFLTYSQ